MGKDHQEKNIIMGSHLKLLPMLALHFLLFSQAVSLNKNGESILKSVIVRDFVSSLGLSEGRNGFQQNSAMLHPYLQNLLENLGSKQVDNGIISEWLLTGVSSADCKGHLLEWSARFFTNTTDITTDSEKWALQLLDAWGKIPEGILSGHINSMGDFHECIGIEARNIKQILNHAPPISRNFEGRYCTAYFLDLASAQSVMGPVSTESKRSDIDEVRESFESFRRSLSDQSEMGVKESLSLQEFIKQLLGQKGLYIILPSLAACMPNSCSQLDFQHVLMNLLNVTYSQIPGGVPFPPEVLPWPLVAICKDAKQPELDGATIIVIILISVIGILSLAAAITDYWIDKSDKEKPTGLAFKYFMAFSLYTNMRKWMSTWKGAEDFGCIHGIRFFSTAWVVIGHTFESSMLVPPWNMLDLKTIWKNGAMMALVNGTFTVDTFFALSGTLAAYSILRLLSKTKGKLNLIMFYVHRYIRLTPIYATVVGINATLLIYMVNGPLFDADLSQKFCRDNWWANLLYINNIYKIDAMCVAQSWYLANDMQFYILSPFIVYPIWKWEKIGLALLSVYTALSIISPILIVRYHGATPAMIVTGNIDATFMELYFRPWARIQVFLVGIWLGWLLYKTRGRKIVLPKVAVLGLWLCSTAAACAVLFGIQPWFNPDNEVPEVAGYFYAALSRFTWGAVVCWVIFACIKGYGGIVNSFLGWRVFMPLGRLSYCVYLTSLQFQQIYHGRLAQPQRYDIYTTVNIFFGHLVMCHFVGFLFMLFYESPFIILQKLIFEGDGGSAKKETKQKAES